RVARLQHVGDAGRENAPDTGDFFVNAIVDTMRKLAQPAFVSGEGDGIELGLPEVVHQTVADCVLSAGLGHATEGEVVRPAATPFAEGDLAVFVQIGASCIDQAELARARKIGANDLGNVTALGIAAEIGNGNGILRGTDAGDVHTQLGVRGRGGHRHGGSQDGSRPTAPRRGIAADCSGRVHVWILLSVIHSVDAVDPVGILATWMTGKGRTRGHALAYSFVEAGNAG